MKRALVLMLFAFAPLLSAFAADPAVSLPSIASQQEQNKTVAKRVFEEIFNQGKFQVANEIYAPDFVNHGLHRDADLREDQAAAQWEKTACPDLTMSVNLMVAENDLVTAVWTARGTNTGHADGLPATGAKIELRGITVWRIADGKIREEWTAFDQLRVVRQILTQLKWPLVGFLCVLAILVWAAARFVRRLRLTPRSVASSV